MNKICSYFNFALTQLSKGTYSLVPIRKLGNHEIFNKIFTLDNIVVKEFKDAYMYPEEQFIIIFKTGTKEMPLCTLSREKDLQKWCYLPMTSISEDGFTLIGCGKFYHEIEDLILYTVDPRSLEFSVFIMEDRLADKDQLYSKFQNGDLFHQIERFWGGEVRSWEELVQDFENICDKIVGVPYINPEPYSNSL